MRKVQRLCARRCKTRGRRCDAFPAPAAGIRPAASKYGKDD